MTVQLLSNQLVGQTSRLFAWNSLGNGDTGQPLTYPDYGGDMTVAFTGAWGSGGSVSLEGSNDGTNWSVLTNPQGAAITKTSPGVTLVAAGPQFVRPHVTAGDGTTEILCTALVRKIR